MTDAYYSLTKSLFDASINAYRKIRIEWLDCSIFDPEIADGMTDDQKNTHKIKVDEFWSLLEKCNGIVVPGGK